MLGKLDRYVHEKIKLHHLLTLYRRIHWIKDLNIRLRTIKVLEENTGNKISDIFHRNTFSDILPQAREAKEKNEQMGLHQTKKVWNSKRNHQQNEKIASE